MRGPHPFRPNFLICLGKNTDVPPKGAQMSTLRIPRRLTHSCGSVLLAAVLVAAASIVGCGSGSPDDGAPVSSDAQVASPSPPPSPTRTGTR